MSLSKLNEGKTGKVGVVEENVYRRYEGEHRQSQLKGSRWYLHRERHNTTPPQLLKHHAGLRHLLEPRQPVAHFIKAATTCPLVSLLHFDCLHKIVVVAALELKAIISRKTLLAKELQTLMKCHSVTPSDEDFTGIFSDIPDS